MSSNNNKQSNKEQVKEANKELTEKTLLADNKPDNFPCPDCDKSFKRESSLKGHMMKAHKRPYKSPSQSTQPPQRSVEPVVEPLPDALEHLDTLLKEHGITRRSSIIRSMELREPENLTELMYVLGDMGINKSRQRRIIADYARWLGVEVPEQVIEHLTPTNERDRWNRPSTSESPFEEEPTDTFISDIERGRTLRAYRRQIDAETDSIQGYGRSNPELQALKDEMKELREKLTTEKEARLNDKLTALEEKINTANSSRSELQTAISAIEKLGEKYLGILTIGVTGFQTKSAPKRERIEGKNTIYSLIPEELIEK